jgi:hypothetical protein
MKCLYCKHWIQQSRWKDRENFGVCQGIEQSKALKVNVSGEVKNIVIKTNESFNCKEFSKVKGYRRKRFMRWLVNKARKHVSKKSP